MRLRVALLGLALVLAGCAGSPAPPSASESTGEPAGIPAPDTETGAVAGTVVDDESRPIPGARVAVVETQTSTTADATGAFTVNGLAPGTYRLIAEALGYQSVARKVDVAAEATANVSFVLAPIALASEAYYLPILRTSLINFDQQWFSYGVNVLGHLNHSAVCGNCIQTIYFDPVPQQIVTENHWQQTGVVGYNDALTLWYNWTAPGNNAYNMYYCWHDQKNWTAAELDSIQKGKVGRMMFTAQSGYFAVSFQHRVDTWTSFAYGKPFDEEFTVLPPGGTKQSPSTCDL